MPDTCRPAHRRGIHPAAPVQRSQREVPTSTTHCSRSTRRSASSTATPWPGRTHWFAGKRSLVTSSTGRRRSSMSSSARASRSGASRSGVVPAAAARLRGPGPGPLLGPDRALPVAVCAGQHDGRPTQHPGQLFPPAALARAGRPGEADDRVHAQVDCAAQGRHVGHGPTSPRARSSRCSPTRCSHHSRPERPIPQASGECLLVSGKVYYDLVEAEAAGRAQRHRADPGRAAVPAVGRSRSPPS